MKCPFNIEGLEQKISAFESKTNVELIVMAASKSDDYSAGLYRFALFLSFTATLVFERFFPLFSFDTYLFFLFIVLLFVLSVGKYTPFPYWFSFSRELENETLEQAWKRFSEFKLHYPQAQECFFIFFSLTEKRIHFLYDAPFKAILNDQEMKQLMAKLQAAFQGKKFEDGLTDVLAMLEKQIIEKKLVIEPKVFHIPNHIVWLK
jgi:uncharacterized membrane protein